MSPSPLDPDAPPRPVALITGAGSGIGRALARQLAARGYRLALVGRRTAPLEETAASLPATATPRCIPADAGDTAQITGAIDAAIAHFGRLDVLVNNAGVAPLVPIDQTTPGLIDECFRTNAIGPAAAIARAWPTFVRQHAGCIVNVSTMGTADPFPGFFAYAASKASVNLMARSCAKEGAAHNIRAYSVAPGAVETPMLRALFSAEQIPAHRCLTPEAVAAVIVECITGEGATPRENGATIFVPSP